MDVTFLKDPADLEAIYGTAVPTSLAKVSDHLTTEYRRWIATSRFCVLSTVGPEGTDGTPRGDAGPVVGIEDDRTLLMPDWAGNNRIDSLRNILGDPRLSLMFMHRGSNTVVRVNGTGGITVDEDLVARFDRAGKRPRSVLVVTIGEVYFQCAKALMRSEFWAGSAPWEVAGRAVDLPTAGDFIKAMTGGRQGGHAYDAAYEERAKHQFWVREAE